MRKRTQRQDVIRAIVRDNRVRTQRDLAAKLQEAGFECTQATISRDITDMGLLKSDEGFYVLPEDMRLRRMVSELVEEANLAGCLVVVRTYPGSAASVAEAIDSAGLPQVLGSVAGDDTTMVATPTPEDAAAVKDLLETLRRR